MWPRARAGGVIHRIISAAESSDHSRAVGRGAVHPRTRPGGTVSLSPPSPSVPAGPPPRRAGHSLASAPPLTAVPAAAPPVAAATGLVLASGPLPAEAASGTGPGAPTAWHNGSFAVDPESVVSR